MKAVGSTALTTGHLLHAGRFDGRRGHRGDDYQQIPHGALRQHRHVLGLHHHRLVAAARHEQQQRIDHENHRADAHLPPEKVFDEHAQHQRQTRRAAAHAVGRQDAAYPLVRNEQLWAMLEKRLEETDAWQGEFFCS